MGYPCCTGCSIIFTDNDGDWGYENGEWCGIDSSLCNSQNQQSSECFSEELGFSCCKECEVVYTDNDGKWGYENDEWCGIKDNCHTKTKTTTTTTTVKKTTTKTKTSSTTVTKIDESQYSEPTIRSIDDMELVFSEEFEGNELDRSVWDVEVNCWGGGNGEKQCYVDHDENIFIKNGQLHIKAVPKGQYKLTDEEMKQCTNNYENSCGWTQSVTSGRIRTYMSGHAWKYGKVRVKAKLPAGPYLWPAIWMLPQDYVYGSWASSGEIDIMEARGQIADAVGHAIHFGGEWPYNDFMSETANVKNVINDFHVYGIDWEENFIIFTVDENPYFTVDLRKNFWSGKGPNPYTDIRQPFNEKFHLILNVAVGGNYFENIGEFDFNRDTPQWTRPEMIVDYVRVYQRPGQITEVKPIEVFTESPGNDYVPDIPSIDDYTLVFKDDFESSKLDRSVWDVEVNCWGGGNAEKQCYVDHDENIFIKNGQLHIKAVPKGGYRLSDEEINQCTNNVENSCSWSQSTTSGRIRTYKSGHAWRYAKIRVKAKLPAGPYLWPSIMMLPQDNVYGEWASSGEIDILKAKGQVPNAIENAIHFGGSWPNNGFAGGSFDMNDVINNFHVYGLDWTEDALIFSIDEKVTYSIDLNKSFWTGKGTNPYTDIRQPFDEKFHLILNVGVAGGSFEGYGAFDYARDTPQWTRPEMIIDYVHVYQKPDQITEVKPVQTFQNNPNIDPSELDIPGFDDYELVFNDEFESSKLDRSVWDVEVDCWGGGNAEKQCYVDRDENIYIKDGSLHIKAIPKGQFMLTGTEKEKCTNNVENSCSWTQDITSGRIRTFKSGNAWRYGKIRVKAKLPAGPFFAPSIMMLPQDNVYGEWASSGEIDIMKAKGQVPGAVESGIHFGGPWPNNAYAGDSFKFTNNNDFHVYGLDWDEDYITFSVDEEFYGSIDLRTSFWTGKGSNPYTDIRQPFDEKFHLILGVAIAGGSFESYGAFNYARDTSQWTNPEMIVDYVRVYQKK